MFKLAAYRGDRFTDTGRDLRARSGQMLVSLLAGFMLLFGLFLALALRPSSSQAAPPSQTASVPVSFTVRNTDSSKVSCSADGQTYVVRGHIVGPAASLQAAGPKPAALYVHGLSYGEFFWRFEGSADIPVSGYDYATEQAGSGLTSVVIDRLGYGASDKPPGQQVCIGSEADYLHQIIGQLRNGSYGVGELSPAPRFGPIALAGHSLGGDMAQAEAYSFNDIDALLIFSFADQGQSSVATTTAAQTQSICAQGGMPPTGASGPAGYAYFGQTAQEFQQDHFFNANPRVVQAATELRTRDPCGDTGSVLQAEAADYANLSHVSVPVLLMEGANDALFPPPSQQQQAGLFTGSRDVTQITLPDTGHAIALGRTAPQFRSAVADWLLKRGFATQPPGH